MASTRKSNSSLSGARYSASGEASRAAQQRRVETLTPVERVALALALGRKQKRIAELRGKKAALR